MPSERRPRDHPSLNRAKRLRLALGVRPPGPPRSRTSWRNRPDPARPASVEPGIPAERCARALLRAADATSPPPRRRSASPTPILSGAGSAAASTRVGGDRRPRRDHRSVVRQLAHTIFDPVALDPGRATEPRRWRVPEYIDRVFRLSTSGIQSPGSARAAARFDSRGPEQRQPGLLARLQIAGVAIHYPKKAENTALARNGVPSPF